MDNHPIGILDSGIGGLSIWKEIVVQLPNESTVYIADSLNCPYGNKPKDETSRLAEKLVSFLLKKEVKIIVIACNTITVSCLDKLRKDFPAIPIIGTVPVVKTAAQNSKNKRIGILSTKATSKSIYQKNLIDKFANGCQVVNKGTDKLVPLIEKGETDNNLEKILKEELKDFIEADIDTLALGCTHFPLIKERIKKVLGRNVEILDSSGAIARQTRRVLENNNALSSVNNQDYKFYTTGDINFFKKAIKNILNSKTEKKVQLVSKIHIEQSKT